MSTAQQTLLMVGAGGMGMAPLALYLRGRGYRVLGYDDQLRHQVRELLAGAGVELLASAELPQGVDRVVRTSAARLEHPLIKQAIDAGIPVLRRGEMLAEEARQRRFVAIAGSHGKTTTTAMLISALRQAGTAADYVLGGLFADGSKPASYTGIGCLAAEVDESDGTIDGFSPAITALVNLDWDHADYYQNPKAIEAAFGRLCARTSEAILLPEGDLNLLRIAQGSAGDGVRIYTVGQGGDFSYRPVEQRECSTVIELAGAYAEGQALQATVNAGGLFNAANGAMALAAAKLIGAELSGESLRHYPGVRRRQTLLFNKPALAVFQDYAHHPAEIEAFLTFARQAYPERRLVVVFQPHRYTRTLQFKERFASVLSSADRVALLEVYAASEAPIEGANSAGIVELVDKRCEPVLADSEQALFTALAEERGLPRVILFVGAGDIEDWADEYVEHLKSEAADGLEIMKTKPNAKKSEGEEWWQRALALLDDKQLKQNEPLAKKTTMMVGGNARYYAEPQDEAALEKLVGLARGAGVEIFFLGRGSNLIVADSGFDGLVIRLGGDYWSEIRPLGDSLLYARAGARLKQLCGDAAKLGLKGFEFLEGIPGTVGGSLRMNAGAMGNWIFDVVHTVRFMSLTGTIHELPAASFHAGYRHCAELREAVALSAVFKASGQAGQESIRQQLEAFSGKRKSSQPREPSAGCIFKNPDGNHAGKLIDQLGLKGKTVGGAMVSPVHGNFIVNTGAATATDVLTLVREVRAAVLEKTGIALEPEALLLGKKWEEML